MRRTLQISVAIAALVAGASVPAHASSYIPVPMVPGAGSEIVFSINNHNVVAGSFRDSANVEHGFFGPLDGSNWTTFDFPDEGTTGTEARYISDRGAITGIATKPAFTVGEEFYRAPDGTFSVFQRDGQPLDGVAQGMNSNDTNVGDYLSTDGQILGYIGKKGRYSKDSKVRIHGKGKFPRISPRGVNDRTYDIVGYFVDQNGTQHGFWQDLTQPRAKAEVIDYPDSQSQTVLEDINQKALWTGQWQDSGGNTHAFIRVYGTGFVDLDPEDGSTSQQAWGANDHGLVALSTNIGQSYIYCPKNPEKCPSQAFLPNSDHVSGRANVARP